MKPNSSRVPSASGGFRLSLGLLLAAAVALAFWMWRPQPDGADAPVVSEPSAPAVKRAPSPYSNAAPVPGPDRSALDERAARLAANPLAPMPTDATEELVGSEKIDGHPTKKYKMKATVGGKTREHYQWRATDLKNFPIRTAAVDGTYEQRFTKVELKTPDAKLFETPANCKSMPAVGSPTPPPKAAP